MHKNDTFLGHPIGLRTLFLTEMWERMSYYGMRALLVLYMTAAAAGSNPGLGLSAQEANAIYGVYVGLVYFMVVPGGWLADNLLGHQKAVLIGAVVIALGHYALALPFERTFFLGLLLVILGTGLLKGNISTIVGRLYDDGREALRDAGYTIFYMSINLGSIMGFLICAYLGERIGWHWGFAAAGVGMTLGVYQYARYRGLLGEAGAVPGLRDGRARQRMKRGAWAVLGAGAAVVAAGFAGLYRVDALFFAESYAYFLVVVAGLYFAYLALFAGLSGRERRNLALLFVLFVGAAAFWSGFDQSGGSLTLFARDHTDLAVLGFEVPVGWLQLANPIFVVLFAPIFAGLWAALAARHLDPSLPLKFALALLMMALSFVVMIFAARLAMSGESVGMQWLLMTYLLHTWGELALSPIGLSAFSRYSPRKYAGQMFGLWFTASALGGVLAGLLGGEASGEGLQGASQVFGFMVWYYLAIGAALAALAWFFRDAPAHGESD